MPASSNVQSQLQKIEALLVKIEETNDPATAAAAKELVQTLMEFHGASIERLLEIVHQSGGSGISLIDTLARDETVRSLLLLYGLHPDGLEVRVQRALDKARPYLASHGVSVSLVGVDDAGAVTLRLEGACHGCGATPESMKHTVEEAVYELAPDVTAIVVLGSIADAASAAAFVPLSKLGGNGQGTNGGGQERDWKEAEPAARLVQRSVT